MLWRFLHCDPGRWSVQLQPIMRWAAGTHLRLLSARLRGADANQWEQTIRPLLLPTENWDDTLGWRKNMLLLTWLREGYLLASPSCHRLLPKAEHLLMAPEALPSTALVRSLFEIRGECSKDTGGREASGDNIGGSSVDGVEDGGDDDDASDVATQGKLREGCTRKVPLEDVLQQCGAHVRGRGAINAFCERAGVYEVLTEELVKSITHYVRSRVRATRQTHH